MGWIRKRWSKINISSFFQKPPHVRIKERREVPKNPQISDRITPDPHHTLPMTQLTELTLIDSYY